VKPLDAGQQAELSWILRGNSWTNRSVLDRLGLLLLCVTPTVAVGGVILWLATPHWLLWACLGTATLLLVMSPYVIAPEWFIHLNFRMWSVSDEDASKWKRPDLP
jgi:hypothetical protein